MTCGDAGPVAANYNFKPSNYNAVAIAHNSTEYSYTQVAQRRNVQHTRLESDATRDAAWPLGVSRTRHIYKKNALKVNMHQ